MYCEHCGAKIAADAKFCPECGSEVLPEAAAPVGIPVPPAQQGAAVSVPPVVPVPPPVYAPAPPPAPPSAGATVGIPAPPVVQQASVPPPAPQPSVVRPGSTPPPAAQTYPGPQATRPANPSAAGFFSNDLTVFQYLGMLILMAIPLVNIIAILLWAFKGSVNPNKKNLARAIILMGILSFVVWTIYGAALMRFFYNILGDLPFF